MSQNPNLISTDELHEKLTQTDLRILDASWYLPAQNRDAKAEYLAGHIEGAQYFDIDAMSDASSELPHMLMHADGFAKAVGDMGISDKCDIVIYDGMGLFSAARAWWNFHIMGVKSVRILDGGLPAWVASGHALTNELPQFLPAKFSPHFNADSVVNHHQVLDAINAQSHEILDARSFARFTAEVKEPRAGLNSGHMPSAKSLPFDSLLEDGRLLPADKLRAKLEAINFDFEKPTITSCGSGVTAAVLSLALNTIGKSDYQLYDGSWSQWGALENVPIVTGNN